MGIMKENELPRMLNCGHDRVAEGLSAGYATTYQGYTLCASCCDADQLASMQWERKLYAYHAADALTTWFGGILGRVTRSKVTRDRRQVHVWVRDMFGQQWHGQGPAESGNCLSLRKLKGP